MTPEEIGSQVALEYGQAMTVRVCKADGESMRERGGAGRGGAGSCGAAGAERVLPAAVVVVQNASVLDLKKALRRHVQLRQARRGGVQHLSW